MSRVLIAAGGSGQEIALACLRLCRIADLSAPRTFVVDSDTMGYPEQPTRSDSLHELNALFKRCGLAEPVSFVDPYDRDQVRHTVVDLFSPYGGLDGRTRLVLDALLDKKQQSTSIIDGFHGAPTVGAIAFGDAIACGKLDKSIFQQIDEATESINEKHYIVVAGGTGGGTGPGVIPVLVEHLSKWRQQLAPERRGQIVLSLLVETPWFQIVERKESDIDLAGMNGNSSCLVRYYFSEIASLVDRVLLLGLPKEIQRKSDGANKQREGRHYLNVMAGWLAAEALAPSQLLEKSSAQGMYAFAVNEHCNALSTVEFSLERSRDGRGEPLPLHKAVDVTTAAAQAAGVVAQQLDYPDDVALPREIWALAKILGSSRAQFQKTLTTLGKADWQLLEWLNESCGGSRPSSPGTPFALDGQIPDPGGAAARLDLPAAGHNLAARLLRQRPLLTNLSAETAAAECYSAMRKSARVLNERSR
ncbi:MAG TPA: hypothetical protein VKV28_17335 [Candidatus Binataceae bacterium]|nr:hypothetical protein [Candidatus Binataceae bacterium]